MKSPSPSLTARFFDRVILGHPKTVLLLVFLVVCFLAYQGRNFRLDASADTLLLENDPDLKFFRELGDRYGKQDYVVVTVSPKQDLLSDSTMALLKHLRTDLNSLDRVSSVKCLLDVPLLFSPKIPISELSAEGMRTLESPDTDRALAREEFKHSPLYQNLIASPDLKTTALLVNFTDDTLSHDLTERRNVLTDKRAQGTLSQADQVALTDVEIQLRAHKDLMRSQRHQDIEAIRTIMDKYRDQADLFLGGVSMIADDMITFIRKDLYLFGFGVLFFLIITLGIIFKRKRWIILPLIFCGVSVLCMIGLLGWFGWDVTVISSNFVSLQLIMTMAMAIHLIVYYRECLLLDADIDTRTLILKTVTTKLKPCAYAALTTIAGFGSLVLCDILPVITFGWMMIAGLVLSLVVTFTLFPAILMLLPKDRPSAPVKERWSITGILARFTQRHGGFIVVTSTVALVLSLVGISKLEVENSFIDYFKKSTEIYQGMKVIDRQLGGTTPLDVIVNFPAVESKPEPEPQTTAATEEDDLSFFDEVEDTAPAAKETYWFTASKMDTVKQVHAYLDALPAIGKVLSLATTLQVTEQLNHGKALDSFEMALLYNETPDNLKELLIGPYVSVPQDEVRFSARIRDSEKGLRRNALLQRIRTELPEKVGLKPDQVRLGGMLVLYNNMLQSLFRSQITTLGITILALMAMFLVLFRSLKISLIAIFPNVLSVGLVLGFMGWMGIPLDMMTITIAAISVGIAVDDTIHYIHRFKEEFDTDRNYLNTLHRCHSSIGHAMYYTSVTIIIGFSILALSNFIPSIYFGLLTGLAMVIALIAALTLLPQLIILAKPFGSES
ncbi:MAG: MMPL family transporter [Phycisphaerae bacterium]|nr:MMPL family transporter [Phycisphaerae bacterium]